MSKLTKRIIQYAITLGISGALTFLVLSLNGFWNMGEAALRYKTLADAFTIPGVVLLMLGVLAIIASGGFFDMLSYAFVRLGRALVPGARSRSDQTFYDYKTKKDEKRVRDYLFLFVTGVIFMTLAVIFTLLFYTA